jgi:pyruvate dehydrogenase E2 component (dihydrolipoamide acetyltransferase)
LAVKAGIDLTRLSVPGAQRIARGDLEALIQRGVGAAGAPVAATVNRQSAESVKALYAGRPLEEIPLDRMRRTIAQRMVNASSTIPHFHLSCDVDLERLIAFREEINAAAPKGSGGAPTYRISINDFVVKALALALQAVPSANAAWADDRILRFKHSDVAIAVAVDGGLLTPVLHDAESKSMLAIAREVDQLSNWARAGQLAPQNYQGGATTVTNLGSYGVREFSAIINPPHATILAIGSAVRRPRETDDGAVRFRSQMTVTLSCDHRVLDGVEGARLLAAFRETLEAPLRMVV